MERVHFIGARSQIKLGFCRCAQNFSQANYLPLSWALGVSMGHYDSDILDAEKEINRLKNRIHETYKLRDKNEHKLKEWKSACEEFHSKYEELCFPGGFKGAYERILNGDSKAIEAALCFIELRPYFFRSGYMFKDILRKLNKAPLKPDERSRYQVVKNAYLQYRSKNT